MRQEKRRQVSRKRKKVWHNLNFQLMIREMMIFIIVENPENHSKDFYKRKYNESEERNIRPNGNFVDKDTSISDAFKNLRLFVYDVALYAETNNIISWFIDSCASIHMDCNKYWFNEYYDNIHGTYVYLGDKRSLKVQGYGIICVNFPNGQERQIHNVMYVPGIKNNLIFVSTIVDQDLKVEFVKS